MTTRKTQLIFIPAELQNERGFVPDTKKIRDQINNQTEEFIARGGVIQQLDNNWNESRHGQ